MGRYLSNLICPLSVKEIIGEFDLDNEVSQPQKISHINYKNLFNFGGFPDLYIKADKSFFLRTQKARRQRLFNEDIRSLTSIQEIAQLEVVAELLKLQVGGIVSRSELGKKTAVSTSTVSRWLNVLNAFYYCFEVKPWSNNISRSLIKEPKVCLWDWSLIKDQGALKQKIL